MSKPGFWDNQEKAQSVVSQLSALKAVVEPAQELQREVKDLGGEAPPRSCYFCISIGYNSISHTSDTTRIPLYDQHRWI